ncbi:MAG: Asp23/Gls24 family envelope stress response protein [Clostridia bacterium]|nr:Asp23/Gls24 family envelope stress response protein [Clostridia bacterium]MDD4386694.1 Asp23/Gls24 family envelope stress response protein [Clostridia bacterium]
MQVYAFVGKTGTGKSYNALHVAHKYDIKYIIDDAILIKNNKVICGKSAKTEDTKIASVKAAIFVDTDKKNEMINAIRIENPNKLLILGTSDGMVEKIANNLNLGEINRKIYIEDVVTAENINLARKSRIEDGKHVVPVPTFEIKEQFSGYFLDPLRIFNSFMKNDGINNEKTIIRPTFSYLGKYYIAEKVINSIIEHATTRINGITRIYKVLSTKYIDGIKIEIDVEVKYGINIPSISNRLRNIIVLEVDRATGINIFSININIKGISR